MSYIIDLRKLVWHRTLIMPCACVIIGDGKGNVLLQHRTDNNLWGYHGGSIEIDESVEEALRREIREELKLELDSIEFFKIVSGKEAHYTYPNGDDVSPIDIVYVCHHFHGDLRLDPNEVKEVKWFNLKTLPKEMTLANANVIKDYFSKYSFCE